MNQKQLTTLINLQDALNQAELDLNINGDTTWDFFSNILFDLGMEYDAYLDAVEQI